METTLFFDTTLSVVNKIKASVLMQLKSRVEMDEPILAHGSLTSHGGASDTTKRLDC